MSLLLVSVAGGVGATARFVLDGLIARRVHRRVPIGVVVINVSGSFLLGLLTALALDHTGLGALKATLGTGFLGGYTTFSTASVEAVNLTLSDHGRPTVLATLHAVGMLVASLAAAAVGLWLG